jgi:hypothetical protein
MNESLDVVCGPDGVMRDIHDRPMVVIFKSRPTRRKKIKPKEESTGKYWQNALLPISPLRMLWQLMYILGIR